MLRPYLAAATLPTPAPAPAPRTLRLWWDDPAAGGWADALAAEGLALHGEALDDAAPRLPHPLPDALALHLSRALADQLARLRALRAAAPDTPLLVACRGLRDLDHVLALEMGADDVIDAALPAPVVAARLRALWRRGASAAGPAAAQELRFGALELSLPARRVRLAGAVVALTEGEFEVLWLLASHAGQALARHEILRRVRGLDDHPTDRSIDSRVYRLRAKLGDQDPAQQRIRTVRHRGYVFSPLGW